MRDAIRGKQFVGKLEFALIPHLLDEPSHDCFVLLFVHNFTMAPVLECIILIGLPGAGKTTFYQQRFADTHLHVSKDLWPNATQRSARQQKLIAEIFSLGKSAVIDNTNPGKTDRAPLIRLAHDHGARVIGYFFDVTTRAAVARNANRSGRGKVPNVAIFAAAKRLQPPVRAEGFDELFRIEISEDRSLRISKMCD
jgi:predicted kinase